VPTIVLEQATLRFGARTLWAGVDLTVAPGEFLAVLGPNGSGKTSLIKVLLGLQALSSGTVSICGRPARRGSQDIGHVPQQKGFDRDLPLTGRDLVRLGLDGHRWGFGLPNRAVRQRVDQVLADVGASEFAGSPIGRLSGGEQQRLRIAQALLAEPRILLCDEPLLSLDLHHQREVTTLIEQQRTRGTTIVFVTHEINPVLPYVDRILYLVGGRVAIGTPAEVMTSQVLTDLYGSPVDVLTVRDRLIVVGAPEDHHCESDHMPQVLSR
jgi:zinc/manganese transport system ATP-binding protein